MVTRPTILLRWHVAQVEFAKVRSCAPASSHFSQSCFQCRHDRLEFRMVPYTVEIAGCQMETPVQRPTPVDSFAQALECLVVSAGKRKYLDIDDCRVIAANAIRIDLVVQRKR